VKLLDNQNLRLKKLGEEAAELVAALATHDSDRAVEEGADLLYHLLVALRAEGIDAAALLAALEKRAG
jgi:phosphoribosyl-ATP pyrophosphohydrolase/phosphoribosyl-AMP cyclohydrolase